MSYIWEQISEISLFQLNIQNMQLAHVLQIMHLAPVK